MDTVNGQNKPESVVRGQVFSDMMTLEARHIIAKARDAGISSQFIKDFKKDDFTIYLETSEHGGFGVPSLLTKDIFAASSNWAFKGSFIIVDGENEENRNYISQGCLYRGIVAHAKSMDKLGLIITMSQLSSILSTSPANQAMQCERLMDIKCLYIKDLDPHGGINDWNDKKTAFEGILCGRESSNLPTIISVAGRVEWAIPYLDKGDGNSKGLAQRYGKKIERLFSSGHLPKNNIWRLHVKKS